MQKIGPYRILRMIAVGGMGEVYLAALERAGGFEKQVAIKCILPRLLEDSRFLEFFEREARLAAVLNHRNIVQVFDFGRDEGQAWLAMEYVNGVDLKAVYDAAQGPLPIGLATEIVISCSRALDYAHRAKDRRGRALNIIHRDVSPQNILLSFEGDVKLADFGLAQATARETQEEGTLKGKFAYMSPEQAQGQAIDGRSDQFSLATVFYELLSGSRAFFTEDGADVILSRVSRGKPLVPLAKIAPLCPPAMVSVIERAMSPDRRERYPDAESFAQALANAAHANQVQIGHPELGGWLRAMFPDRAAAARDQKELTVESTAIADMPILTNRGADVAGLTQERELGFEQTESAEIERAIPEKYLLKSSTTEPDSSTQVEEALLEHPEAGTADDQVTQKPIRASHLVLSVVGLSVIVAAFMIFGERHSTGDLPESTPVGDLLTINQATVPSTRTNPRRASIDSGIGGLDSGLLSPSAKTSPAETKPESDASSMISPVVRTRTTRTRRSSKTNSKRKRRTPTRVETPVVEPRTPQDAGTVTARVELVRPENGQTKTDRPSTNEQSKTKTQATGLRARVSQKSTVLKGEMLPENWVRIDRPGTRIRVRSAAGPTVTLLIQHRRGKFMGRVASKPYGKIWVNKKSKGETPVGELDLQLGRNSILVRDSANQETKITLELAE